MLDSDAIKSAVIGTALVAISAISIPVGNSFFATHGILQEQKPTSNVINNDPRGRPDAPLLEGFTPITYDELFARGNPKERYEKDSIYEFKEEFKNERADKIVSHGRGQNVHKTDIKFTLEIEYDFAKVYDGTDIDLARSFYIKKGVQLVALAGTKEMFENNNNKKVVRSKENGREIARTAYEMHIGWLRVVPKKPLTFKDIIVMKGKPPPQQAELDDYSKNGFWAFNDPKKSNKQSFLIVQDW